MEATLRESMRHETLVPNGLPHSALVDTKFMGYDIPKVNIFMIRAMPIGIIDFLSFRRAHLFIRHSMPAIKMSVYSKMQTNSNQNDSWPTTANSRSNWINRCRLVRESVSVPVKRSREMRISWLRLHSYRILFSKCRRTRKCQVSTRRSLGY